jgi:hypothetical protein
MNPLVVATLVLGGACLGLLIWIYRQKTYHEGLLELKDKAFDVQVKNSEIMIEQLMDELAKYQKKEEK